MSKLATTLLLSAGLFAATISAAAATKPLKSADVVPVVQWVSTESIQQVTPGTLLKRMVKYLKEQARAATSPALPGDPNLDGPALARWLDQVTPKATPAQRGAMLRDALRNALSAMKEDGTQLHLPNQYMVPPDQEGYDKGGVGILVDPESDAQGRWVIFETLDGFPGQSMGLKPGDRILKVAGKSVVGQSYRQLADLVRGNLGTKVTLTVERPGVDGVREFEIERVWLNPNPKNISQRLLADGLGYIRIKYLGERMDVELKKALNQWKGKDVKAIVLDLRNNEGLLSGSLDLSAMFLPRGTTFTSLVSRDKKSEIRITPHEDQVVDLPLVVLVNRYTSPAGILMAGALRDAGRARLVGESTVWRDQPQESKELPDGSVVTVTTGYYVLPKGEVLRSRRPSLAPEVTVQMDPLSALGGDDDPQFQRAVEMARSILAGH